MFDTLGGFSFLDGPVECPEAEPLLWLEEHLPADDHPVFSILTVGAPSGSWVFLVLSDGPRRFWQEWIRPGSFPRSQPSHQPPVDHPVVDPPVTPPPADPQPPVTHPSADPQPGPVMFGLNPWGIDGFNQAADMPLEELNRVALTDDRFTVNANRPHNGPSPHEAQFRLIGALAGFGYIDPMFHFGEVSKHLHMFIGHTGVTPYSTGETLIEQGGSAGQGYEANRSTYWTAAMLDGPTNGPATNAVCPSQITIYYKSRHGSTSRLIPTGLHLYSGNVYDVPDGMSHGFEFQPGERIGWGFYDPSLGMLSPAIYDDNGNLVSPGPLGTIPALNPLRFEFIRLVIQFPQCVKLDENNQPILTSDNKLDHTHMLYDLEHNYSRSNEQPPDGFFEIPQITMLIDWRWPEDGDVTKWRLSSDLGAGTDLHVARPGGSAHGNIIPAWPGKVIEEWMQGCYWDLSANCSIGQMGGPRSLRQFTGGITHNQTAQETVLVPLEGRGAHH